MMRYQYTFQAEPRKIIRKQKSDFSTAFISQFPLQTPTENNEITTGNLHKLNHTSQTMQTLCSIEMTAISDDTIEKGEDPPTINASLGETDIQNTANRRGIAGIFLDRYNIISQLMLFCKRKFIFYICLQLTASQMLLIYSLMKKNVCGTYLVEVKLISITLYNQNR